MKVSSYSGMLVGKEQRPNSSPTATIQQGNASNSGNRNEPEETASPVNATKVKAEHNDDEET